jgi:diadenosine tetraphosphatase ApaH/serine/threonine PP2A family protein phosphatase
MYGFRYVVEATYDHEMWIHFNECFSYMPYACILCNVMFVHGGISEGIKRIEDINKHPKGMVPSPEMEELLWNDPADGISGFVFNEERMGFKKFGRDVLMDFLEGNSLMRVVRAHQPVRNGFCEMWDGKLITVFSSPETHPEGKGTLLLFENGEIEPTNLSV